VYDKGALGKTWRVERASNTGGRGFSRSISSESSNEEIRVEKGEKYEIEVAVTDKDALAWRIKRKNKVAIVINLYWFKENYNREDKFEKLVEDINSAIIHEMLHEEVGTENEYIIEKLEKLLVRKSGK